ncbi:MAG TPA: hypothetical protein VFQ82_12375, partial [Stellaceae bacterium]|nr:hypothetical protein [Stellaceae bacterium]
ATMFMRIVGQSVGAAVFGAVLNLGIARHLPGAADMVNRLLAPEAREHLGAAEIARASAAIAAALHNVYIVAVLVAVVGLALALALPSKLSPTRPQTAEQRGPGR